MAAEPVAWSPQAAQKLPFIASRSLCALTSSPAPGVGRLSQGVSSAACLTLPILSSVFVAFRSLSELFAMLTATACHTVRPSVAGLISSHADLIVSSHHRSRSIGAARATPLYSNTVLWRDRSLVATESSALHILFFMVTLQPHSGGN